MEKHTGMVAQFAACFRDHRDPARIEHTVEELVAQRPAPQRLQPPGWFFYGYYGDYCYLQLYIFCGEHLLGARLRPSNIDPATGSKQELEQIVKPIRAAWSRSAGRALGERLESVPLCGRVTSLKAEEWPAQVLYEDLDGARGEMENRLKEQLLLFADRTSTAFLRSNQLRLCFSSAAYLLIEALRRLGLRGTELAQAQGATIRLKALKIGALIRVTVRQVWLSLAGGYPYVDLFRQVYAQLRAAPLRC